MAKKKADRDRFVDVEFKRQLVRDVYQHEVLLGFNGDDQAVAFEEWWHEEGAIGFAAYLKKERVPQEVQPAGMARALHLFAMGCRDDWDCECEGRGYCRSCAAEEIVGPRKSG